MLKFKNNQILNIFYDIINNRNINTQQSFQAIVSI